MNPTQPAFLQDDIDSQTNRSAKPLAPFRIPELYSAKYKSLLCSVIYSRGRAVTPSKTPYFHNGTSVTTTKQLSISFIFVSITFGAPDTVETSLDSASHTKPSQTICIEDVWDELDGIRT